MINYDFSFKDTLEREKHIVFTSDMSERTMKALAHHDNIIKALEKQVPKKPVEGYVFREWFRERLKELEDEQANRKGWCCPSCGNYIVEFRDYKNNKNFGSPFCKYCGQAIDWSEE